MDVSQRILIIDVMTEAAQELAETKIVRREPRHGNLISDTSPSWLVPSDRGPAGAGPWREVSDSGTLLNWSHRYEREVPSRSGQVTDTGMLGVCMKCIAMHPEASAVAPALLDMIRSRWL